MVARSKQKPRSRRTGSTKPLKAADAIVSSLQLTDAELMHIRDLFNVRLPAPSMSYPSVSQSLAAVEHREDLEAELWNKVAELCTDRGISLEQAAPDHVVVLSSPPELAVMACEERRIEEDDDASPFDEE